MGSVEPMEQLGALPTAVLLHLSQQLNIPLKSVVAVISLLDEGATVPFIARYRKEATGNLDEVQIRSTEEKLQYFRELQERKATILDSIQEQDKLTDELKARIEKSLEKSEIEDLYLPYKPKRRTKATMAREKGLEPLAQFILEQKNDNIFEEAEKLISAEKEVPSVLEALQGARDIIAETVSEDALVRESMRELFRRTAIVK